jgi:hypothetical protein
MMPPGEAQRTQRSLIHRSRWKVNSQKFKSMIQWGVLEEITGRRRNRVCAAIQIVKVLEEPPEDE